MIRTARSTASPTKSREARFKRAPVVSRAERVDYQARFNVRRARKREIGGARHAAALSQQPQSVPPLPVKMGAQRVFAFSRSRAARSLVICDATCGMRAAGVPGRAENGKT